MKYFLKPTKFFLKQVENLSEKGKKVLKDKLRLVKENPSRNKRIVGHDDLFLFRIRFTDQNKEVRAIYLLDSPEIILICLLDRGNEYKELKKYLKKLGYL
ncbi:MAG: hypothetical protein ACMXYD_05450 [Candidatus Woesearchaeota archaeon]